MNGPPDSFSFDRRALARSFDRAGGDYDAAAQLQRTVREELIARLAFFKLEPRCILDLGAGTGQASQTLRQRFPRAQVIALDLAPGMLKVAPQPWWPPHRFNRLCADARALPLAAASVDLVFSNLMLQWCDRPDLVFGEIARVLRPGALVVFSSFGPDTLRELREAWASVDTEQHVSEFLDLPQLGDVMMHAGLHEPVMDVEHFQRHHADAHELMRELKRTGAHNAAAARPRGLTGRGRLSGMLAAYERLRTPSGLPATYEVIFGAAFGATPRDAAPPPGEFTIPVSSLRRRTP